MTVTIIKSGPYCLVQYGQNEITSIHTDQDEAIAAGQKLLADRRRMDLESAAREWASMHGRDWSHMSTYEREAYRHEVRLIEEAAQ